MRSVTSIDSARDWGVRSTHSRARQYESQKRDNVVTELRAPQLLRGHTDERGTRQKTDVADEYVVIKSVYYGNMVTFKDPDAVMTREKIMGLVEMCKEHNYIVGLSGRNLSYLDLSGIYFGNANFRYANVDGTMVDREGTASVDFTGAKNLESLAYTKQKSFFNEL